MKEKIFVSTFEHWLRKWRQMAHVDSVSIFESHGWQMPSWLSLCQKRLSHESCCCTKCNFTRRTCWGRIDLYFRADLFLGRIFLRVEHWDKGLVYPLGSLKIKKTSKTRKQRKTETRKNKANKKSKCNFCILMGQRKNRISTCLFTPTQQTGTKNE